MRPTRKLAREREMLKLLADGWPAARVARRYGISLPRVLYIRDRALAEQSTESPFFTVREG